MTKEYVNIESPFTGSKVFEVRDVEKKTFRGKTYTVNVRYYQCEDTGEQFTTTEQDNEWTAELYDQYRAEHGIPSPDEIKKIREGYGLNRTQLAHLLGFGINQLKNYEDGQVPSESNGKMLRLASNPLTLMALLDISRNEFSTSEYERMKAKIAVNFLDNARNTAGALF